MTNHIHQLISHLIIDYPTEYRLRALRDLLNDRTISVTSPPAVSHPWDKRGHIESLAEATARVLTERFQMPCLVRQLIPYLRLEGISLPSSDVRAASVVSAVMGKRRDIFQKFPGGGQKATSQWHLVDRFSTNSEREENKQPDPGSEVKAKMVAPYRRNNMSEENRQKAAERMKRLWAEGKLGKQDAASAGAAVLGINQVVGG